MTLFKRVFNTPPKSEPVAPVDMAEPELDQILDTRALSEVLARAESGPILSEEPTQDQVPSTPILADVTPREIDPIPRDEDYTLARAEDLVSPARAPAAPDPSDAFA